MIFCAIVLSFLAVLLLGIGYMIWDMWRIKRRPTWTSITTTTDDDFSGGGGVAR